MTRMVWVILFALVAGVMLLFFARSLRSGNAVNTLLADISRTHDLLARQYPDARFMLRSASPDGKVRNLVIFIVPGPADSVAAERMADSALTVARTMIQLRDFDSLVVALNGVAVRSLPTR